MRLFGFCNTVGIDNLNLFLRLFVKNRDRFAIVAFRFGNQLVDRICHALLVGQAHKLTSQVIPYAPTDKPY